jgi:hypothetical protein
VRRLYLETAFCEVGNLAYMGDVPTVASVQSCLRYVSDAGGAATILRSVLRKVMWITKDVALFGGTVITLALVFGVAHPYREPP